MDIFLATGNAHKAEEFGRMFAKARLDVRVRSAKELGGMPYVEEITGTFNGNCRLKGEALRAIAPRKAWVLADDSGLCCPSPHAPRRHRRRGHRRMRSGPALRMPHGAWR